MTIPTLFSPRSGLVLDFQPVFRLLDELESIVQREQSFQALADHLFQTGFEGQPLPCGADPLTSALNATLSPSSPARAEVWDERLRLLWCKEGAAAALPLATVDLIDSWPGLVGFLYCLEDGRFLELSPPRVCETIVT